MSHVPLLDESGLAALYPHAWERIAASLRTHVSDPQAIAVPAPRSSARTLDTVAVIPIQGVISRRASLWSKLFGGSSLEDLSAQLQAAREDASIRAVVLHVDSPGGGVYGVHETAQQVAELSAVKPVIAFADGLAASAAYWLVASASRIVAAPSSEVGSIGVYAIHFDQSGYLANLGIVPTLVKAGPFKAEANPYQPLSDEDRDAMQARIDAHYARFVSGVARGRGVPVATVRETYGQGRVLDAQTALDAGMVTDIGTWADVLRIASAETRARASEARAYLPSETDLRLRLALEDVAS